MLGPLLFNLYTASCLSHCSSFRGSVSCRSLFSLCRRRVEVVDSSRLRLYPAKTLVIWLGGNSKFSRASRSTAFQCYHRQLQRWKNVRDLGVVLDSQLTMSAHVMQLSVPVSVPSAASATPNQPFVVGRRCQDVGPSVCVITSGAVTSCLLIRITDGLMRRLQAVQNAAARLIPALADATTSLIFSGSFIGCRSVNVSSSSWPC